METETEAGFPAPVEFGLPEGFAGWRPGQVEAINQAIDTPERFVCLSMPVGAGKSIVGMGAAQMSGLRAVYLTSTKGLQDQLMGDFPEPFSQDVRGMQNYSCTMAGQFGMPQHLKVADGPCMHGAWCPLKGGGCEYFDRIRRAQQSAIVTANYQMWFHSHDRLSGELSASPFKLMICDEGHDILDELCLYLGTTLQRNDCLSLGISWPDSGYDQPMWQEWAEYWWKVVEGRLVLLAGEIKQSCHTAAVHTKLHESRELKAVSRKLARLASMKGEWVVEEKEGMKEVQFDPLWPQEYAEGLLFRGIEKVLIMSATLRPHSVKRLGIPENDMVFQEFPSTFPRANRPVVHSPTLRMNRHTEADDDHMGVFLRKIDLLVDRRKDRKGIIHTVSYRRMRFIFDNSRHQDRMLVHGSGDRAMVIDRFRRAGPGTVLLSPSVDTGYDFKGELAEYQIICKLPFPDTRGRVMKARVAQDKEYTEYLVAQVLQQMVGRVCRAEWDRGETVIIDDNFVWFLHKAKKHFNRWFLESVQMLRGVGMPKPLEKLSSQDLAGVTL